MPEKPRLLIEQWLPIAEIGAECMRERGASSALPPLYFLHVWWARRPLAVSRAAILASLLPAYPTGENGGVRPWPQKFLKTFPTFDAYKAWFLRVVGIFGDPVAARKLVDWEKRTGRRTPGNKYGYPRAFSANPDEAQLEFLYELLAWVWGKTDIRFCDPMAGGGTIPFEALRYGLSVRANELNPVASVILKATLDYPARFGPSLVDDIRRYGRMWSDIVRARLSAFYPPHPPTPDESLKGGMHLWARTVACPVTGKPVPLSPNWWLIKGSTPVAVRLLADPKAQHCHFQVVRGNAACERIKPDQGTVKQGTGISPWTGEAIHGDYIKAEAQAGRMGHQLYAIEVYTGKSDFRAPEAADEKAFKRAAHEANDKCNAWQAAGLVPTESLPEFTNYDRGHRLYGIQDWKDFFSPRQLLAFAVIHEAFRETRQAVSTEVKERTRADAILTILALAFDKCLDYNCIQTIWHASRSVVGHKFTKHNYTFQWSYVEFDASRNLLPWAIEQVADAYLGIAKLSFPQTTIPLFGLSPTPPIARLRCTNGPAQRLDDIRAGDIDLICVDPPYYDNVQYAECSDFFYVWLKRLLDSVHPHLFSSEVLSPKDEEAVANPARFEQAGRSKKKALAEQDYENKMMACFKEMNRILATDGVLTVMFTHKRVEAWDTLGTALLNAGFKIDASWPVHTESEHSLHQAKKNAATSTILLICRKRDKADEPVWWDDLKGEVRAKAREAAARFEKEGIRGVDLYISTFGPVLAVISERWPVLTSQTDPKTGDPLPLKPGDALDLARQEVINLRKRGLLLGRTVEFDPVTDWYLMAWDAFRAQEFPADEARRLALALGLDIEADIIRAKRLVSKKSASVVLQPPAARRKRGMVDPEAEVFPHLVDALHTAMLVYDEEGSKACQVFVDRRGFRNDSRLKVLVQAMMEAISTTRDKQGKFVRPEMATLEAMRLLFWSDLPAPKEEEPPPSPDEGKLLTEEGAVWLGEEGAEDEGEEENDEA